MLPFFAGMHTRFSIALGFLLAACGSSDSEDALAGANHLTAEDVAARGTYCCFDNGSASANSPPVCSSGTKDCIWSEAYSDVNSAGRGTVCGYLACP
jgi:hypothetical protein